MEINSDIITSVLRYLPQAILFYGFLFLVGWYFFRRIPKEPWRPPKETGRLPYGQLSAVGIYLLLTLLYFAPDLTRLGSMLIGPPEDNMQSYWNMWYGWEVFRGHYPSLLHTKVIGYPEGVSLLYHSFSYYNLWLSFLLRHIDGLVLAYNLLLMHTFVVGGLGAFLLGRYLLRDDYLALVVGFIFAFSPFHFARVLHHINIASIQFVPFFVLFYIRAIREHQFRYSLLAGIFLVLNGLCSWAFLILDLYFIMIAYAYLVLRRRRIFLWDVIGRSSMIVGLTFVMLSPLLVPMILSTLANPAAYMGGHSTYVADLAGFFIPNSTHWLGRMQPIRTITETFTGNPWESAVYLGLSAVIIILVTVRHNIEESSRYILGLLVCLVLSMGAWLHVLGWSTRIPLPYGMLIHVPLFSNMRAPSRHIVFAYLFLALLVGIGLRHLYRSRQWTARARVSLVALVVLILMDFYSYDARMTPVTLPPAYQAILQDGDGAILDLPVTTFRRFGHAMMYQTIHRRPLVTAYISRKLEKTLSDYLDHENIDIQLQQLIDNKVCYIVVHKEFLDKDPFADVDTLAYDARCPRLYADDTQIVYVVY